MINSDSAKLATQLVNMIKSDKDEASFITMINNKDVKGAFLNNQSIFIMFANTNSGDECLHLVSMENSYSEYINCKITKEELSVMSKDIMKLLNVEGKDGHIPYLHWDMTWELKGEDIMTMSKSTFAQVKETLNYDVGDTTLY